MIEEKFPQRFTWAREASGLSQSEIARRIVPQIAPQSVQQWEAGVTVPRGPRLKELARVLQVRDRWLAFGELPVREGDMPSLPGAPVGADPSPDDWREAVRQRLPAHHRQYAGAAPLPGYPLLYASPSMLADVCGPELTDCQAALWRLSCLARLYPRQTVRLYVPLEAALAQLQWEAHPAGIAVQYAGDPAAIASELSA